MLIYFIAIWNILQAFGIFYDHLVHFVSIWYILPVLVSCTDEKSGNPGGVTCIEWSRCYAKIFASFKKNFRGYANIFASFNVDAKQLCDNSLKEAEKNEKNRPMRTINRLTQSKTSVRSRKSDQMNL
jgi:hypothetical protein